MPKLSKIAHLYTKLFATLLIVLLSSRHGFTRQDRYESILDEGNVTIGAQLTTTDLFYTGVPSWYANIPLQKVKNYIVFRLDPDATVFVDCNYTVTVTLDIVSLDKDGNQTILPPSQLTIEYNNDRGATHKDQAFYLFNNGHQVEVTISNIVTNYSSGTCTSNQIPPNLRLDNVIEVERYFTFDPTATVSFLGCPPTDPFAGTGCRYEAARNELILEWDPIAGAEEYDLEWLHVNNYDGIGGELSPTSISFNFKNNSTRIQTSATTYAIQAVFEQGFVVFRVRAVGRGGSNFSVPVTGSWTIPDGPQLDPSLFCHFKVGGNNEIVPIYEADEMNWQYVSNYAEDGKNKLSVSFFDGSLRNRQSVSKINTDGQAIVGETIYDHQGRGAVQVLPTPTYDPKVLYYEAYNLAEETVRPYAAQDFDEDLLDDNCTIRVTPMDNSTGSANYYSPSNINATGHQAYIPDAHQYPFSQIEYTPDNTGRIRRQGGVGSDHQLDSKHETKYYYGKPTQEHMDRLFGHEVGYFSHYKKNMVVDANGQISVSYLDQQGRVIATALAGDSIQGMWRLESNKQLNPDLFSVNLLDNKPIQPGEKVLESTFTYLATTKGNHDFFYSITAEQFQPECLGEICYDCVYDLVISIKDECGNEQIPGVSNPNTTEPLRATIGPSGEESVLLDTTCESVNWDDTFSAYLEVGNYTITKTLYINEEAMDFYLEDYLTRESCVIPLDHFIQEEFNNTDFSLCDPPDECRDICQLSMGEGATPEEIQACILECEFASPCEAGRIAMLADFYPGGQYARFTEIAPTGSEVPELIAADNYSIFNQSASAYFDLDYSHPDLIYRDNNGNAAVVTLPNGNTVPPNDLSVTQFILYFQASWAETWFGYHPEYCDYQLCSTTLLASDQFDHSMQTTETYEEALALNLLNPLGMANAPVPDNGAIDPFFVSVAYGTTVANDMVNYINNQTISDDQTSLTMDLWHLAAAAVKCNDPDLTTTQQKLDCVNGVLDNPSSVTFYPFDNGDPCINDRIWKIFRGLYLAKKTAYLETYKEASCAAPPGGQEERFPSLSQLMTAAAYPNIFTSTAEELENAVATEPGNDPISDACDMQCRSYALNWLNKLIGCQPASENWSALDEILANAPINTDLENYVQFQTFLSNNPVYAQLRSKLIEICKEGCDANNPLGASSVGPNSEGVPSVNGQEPNYMNFEDAIESITGGSTYQCYADLINMPLAYNHSYPAMTIGGNMDDCACDKILSAEQQYAGLPSSTPFNSFGQFFQAIYGVELENATGKACICNKAFEKGGNSWSPEALDYLTASGEFVPAMLACINCVDCAELKAAWDAELLSFNLVPDLDGNFPDGYVQAREQTVATHLNNRFNLNFAFWEYQDFIAECDLASANQFYCDDITIEALDLEHLLDDLVNPSTTSANNGTSELLDYTCLCLPPYGNPLANPQFPVTPANAGTYLNYANTPHYTNSLIDHINPNYLPGTTLCDHYYEFSSISGNTLTGTIFSESDNGSACTLTLNLPDGYDFEHIISFSNIQPDPNHLGVGTNTYFLIDAQVVMGNTVVTITLSGHTDCFPIVTCYEDPSEMTLCELPGSSAPEEDPCLTSLENTAIQNALNSYTTYLDQVKAEFEAAYRAKCLSAVERFNMEYLDNEYHYTLYYYDQAGNLIKTVPPEGVELLTEADCVDEVPTDRSTNDRSVFSRHRMATKYTYNSLNQLVTQHLPDHDDQYDWRLGTPLINPATAGLSIHDISFANLSSGFFFADDPANPAKSLIYQTIDGGETWNAIDNIELGKLNGIQFLSTELGYAVGDAGTLVKTENSGDNWCLISTGATDDLIDLFFKSDQSNGIIFERNGATRLTLDGGNSWSVGPIISIDEFLDAHFYDDNIGYAVGRNDIGGGLFEGVIYTTNNGGGTWSKQTDISQVDLSVVQFISPTEGYAIGKDGTLLRASDGGASWVEIPIQLGTNNIAEDLMDIHFTNLFTGVVLTEGGKLYSTNSGGNAWNLAIGAPTSGIVDLYFNNSTGFLVTQDRKIYTSSNAGLSWSLLSQAGGTFSATSIMIESGGTARGIMGSSSSAIRLSPNGGTTWSGGIPGLPTTDIQEVYSIGNGSTSFALANGDVYQFSGSWIDGPPSVLSNVVDLFFLPSSTNGWALTASGEVWKWNNSIQQWGTVSNIVPPAGVNMKGLFFFNTQFGWAVGEQGTIYKTNNGGNTWTLIPNTDLHIPSLHAAYTPNSTTAYAVGEDGTIVSTSDGGNSWTVLSSSTDADLNTIGLYNNSNGVAAGSDGTTLNIPDWAVSNPTSSDIHAITFSANDLGYFVGADGTIGRQTSVGGVWTMINTGLMGNLNAIATTTDSQTLFAVGDNGTILKTTNSATSWINLELSIQPEQILASHFPDPNHGFAVGKDGIIIKTTNGGITWTPVASGVHQTLHGVHFINNMNGVIVGDNGAFRYTTDGGVQWSDAVLTGGTFDIINFQDVVFSENGTTGYAVGSNGTILRSTGGLSNWTLTAAPVGIVEQLNAVVLIGKVGYIAGNDGVLLKSWDCQAPLASWLELKADNGERWAEFNTSSTVDDNFYDLHFNDYETGYVVGQGGLLLKTISGGDHWTQREAQTTESIFTLHVNSDGESLIGGSNMYLRIILDGTDRFSTRFWYDQLGRLVASQNSKQFAMSPPRYSYTKYDALGRVVEVGELESSQGPSDYLYATNYPNNWSTTRYEVTRTQFDYALGNLPLSQQNLRSRVASVYYFDVYQGDNTEYRFATHYDYDIHGNIRTLWQENRDLEHLEQSLKQIHYVYDLVSGNVNEVHYQAGQCDQFFHRYTYDADNRIIAVYTSTDGTQWDRDAAYQYYHHGPLARTEIGDNRVQGVDYAYSIQGWMIGANANTLDPSRDIGEDGLDINSGNGKVARDSYGFGLNYYGSDYQSVNPLANPFRAEITGSSFEAASPELWNGNIRQMVTALSDPNGQKLDVQGTAYEYDQLNRLKKMTAFSSPDILRTNSFGGIGPSTEYGTFYQYDANGNIEYLKRNGGGGQSQAMDQMTYRYKQNGAHKLNNRLYHVNDAVSANNYSESTNGTEDIDDQGSYDPSHPFDWNYSYDQVGNLTQDKAEEIERIEWTLYGKIKKVIRTSNNHDKPDLEFTYDANGQRIMKLVKPRFAGQIGVQDHWTYTYYVRDASGKIMATYKRKYDSLPFPPSPQYSAKENFNLGEYMIYGSSRLGLEENDKILAQRYFFYDDLNERKEYIETRQISANLDCKLPVSQRLLGNKLYELSNHLGNVLVTTTDRKIAIGASGQFGYFGHDINGYSDYYPFGMLMPNKHYGGYRFGFSGMERDDELKSTGNSLDFGARTYGSRLGKWFSLDPSWEKYPDLSPYNYVSNSPLWFEDLDGKEFKYANKESRELFKKFRKYADSDTRRTLKTLKRSDIAYNINLTTQAAMRLGMAGYVPSNGITRYKGLENGVPQVHLMIDMAQDFSIQLSSLAEEVSHSEDLETGEIGILGFGRVGAFLGADVHDEIRSKDVSLRFMTNAVEKDNSLELSEINKEWGAYESQTSKIKALTGGNSKLGNYSQLSVESLNVLHFDEKSVKADMKKLEETNGMRPSEVIFKKGKTATIIENDAASKTGRKTCTTNCCFSKGTRILLSEKIERNIEDIDIGDSILVFDFIASQFTISRVHEITSPIHQDIIKIQFSDSTVNKNTFDHSYYTKEKGWCSYMPEWTKERYGLDAKQLEEGDTVYKVVEGAFTEVAILRIEEVIDEIQTYNIIAEGLHNNYFANGILVHNEKRQTSHSTLSTSGNIKPQKSNFLLVESPKYTINHFLDKAPLLVLPPLPRITPLGQIGYYVVDVKNYSDYYPFGMLLPDRVGDGLEYPFGFNGVEKDNEINSFGGSYSYEFRNYDSRIGKFSSLDPLGKAFPFYSPYSFANNNPIKHFDLEGLKSEPRSLNYAERVQIFGKDLNKYEVFKNANPKWSGVNTDNTLYYIYKENNDWHRQKIFQGDPHKPVITILREQNQSEYTRHSRYTSTPEVFVMNFGANSDRPFEEAKERFNSNLFEIANLLSQNPDLRVQIQGQSTGLGAYSQLGESTIKGNQIKEPIAKQLADARTNFLQQSLIDLGVNSNQIEILQNAYGETTTTTISIYSPNDKELPINPKKLVEDAVFEAKN